MQIENVSPIPDLRHERNAKVSLGHLIKWWQHFSNRSYFYMVGNNPKSLLIITPFGKIVGNLIQLLPHANKNTLSFALFASWAVEYQRHTERRNSCYSEQSLQLTVSSCECVKSTPHRVTTRRTACKGRLFVARPRTI